VHSAANTGNACSDDQDVKTFHREFLFPNHNLSGETVSNGNQFVNFPGHCAT